MTKWFIVCLFPAASRTVNHYLGKSPSQDSVTESPVPMISVQLASRLGTGSSTGKALIVIIILHQIYNKSDCL